MSTISNQDLILELKTMQRKQNVMLALAVLGLFFGFLIFIVGIFEGAAAVITGIVILGAGILFLALWASRKKDLKNFAGERITAPVLREFMELESFDPNAFTDREELKTLSFLPGHNTEHGSDLIRGIYKGNRLELCDLTLQTITSTGKTVIVVTNFQGQLLSYGLGRTVEGCVEITKKTAGKPDGILKRMRNWGTSVSSGRTFENLETENEAFNRMFDVRAENPHTAFLILTPQFMERLMEVNEREATDFCFTGDRLYMAIRSEEDRFEIGGTIESASDVETVRQAIRADFMAAASLLDVLRENEFLFTQETQNRSIGK
ncbi:MAG: DUF3137 domain-containing protein [Lachnospiraceae bacterium]|nr:DUF3137 domain-containing protein [Lachnospiraceae bacterium]